MESHQDTTVHIMQMGKRGSAAFINDEMKHSNGVPSENLSALLRTILDPDSQIDDTENIDWCKWIIAGGRTLSDFAATVAGYDNHAKCGLVWVPHVVAYRCRTCGISPCMSICRNCFKKGDHSTHDFNMFLSQAGGACDCGDTSVMKAEGFCSDHGINNTSNKSPVPNDLMAVAEAVMPQLLLRLLYHFRDSDTEESAKRCDEYIGMLMELNNMGELMRRVMTKALINSQLYKELVEPKDTDDENVREYMILSKQRYDDAVQRFPRPDAPDEYKHLAALGETINHATLLEEFIFWTFKLEFPQNIVCFLLNMIPEQDYKEHLTRTFVMHYSRIPSVLEMSKDPDTLSNRVVHMSVQLFSNESLALKMVEELSLLHVMVISLKMMMTKNLIENTLHDPSKNFHYVIDCSKPVMKDHCYWPLVSDFNNVLSHESVALVFLRNDKLVDMWFQFLFMLQGMNVNERETGTHVEYEPGSYYAAFSCELEASAYPMWSIISHLKDATHTDLANNILRFCIKYLKDWLKAIFLYQPRIEPREMLVASFHFPLHRYLAAFTCQAVKCMGMSLNNILPSTNDLTLLMIHPLRVQSFFYEILAGVWIRNGLQIKGQAMTYIQANFCNSMVDMDLFFLQICATQLPAQTFLTTAIEIFGVKDWLGMCPLTTTHELEQDSMLEGLLTFLATLVTSRTNLGNTEQTQCIIEISALLATGDKTHSQLLELMPERSGNAHTRNFDTFLKELSNFRRPPQSSENLEQGLFIPVSAVWEKYYDPLHVLLRAIHRRDFQNSMDRFTNYVKQENKMPKSGVLWPPFRLPRPIGANYSDPSFVLHSRVFHSTILGILYRAVHSHNISEHMLALAIFLLEVAVTTDGGTSCKDTVLECGRLSSASHRDERDPPELLNCYPGDCLSENLRYCVSRISLASPEPQGATCANYTLFDSDIEYEISESETLPMLVGNVDGVHQSSGMELAVPHDLSVGVPQDLSIVRGQSLVLHTNTEDSIMDEDLSPTTQSLPPITMSENDQAITEYLPGRQTELHIDTHLPLQASTLMEVAIRRNLGSSNPSREVFRPATNAATGMLLPFQRVQPVPVTSTNLDVVPIQSAGLPRIHSGVKSKTVESSSSLDDSIVIEESIISLLLKLHSQLSGTLDSFSLNESVNDVEDMVVDSEPGPSNREYVNQPTFATVTDSRIGDGPFFIGNLLHKIANLDEMCALRINEVRQSMWPNQREKQAEQKAAETREKEERSKRARERQQKLMEDFANKQKKFMETSAEGMDCCEDEEEEVEQLREKEYVCIICNRTNPSTENNPIGLVVLVESSGVVGHRRKTNERLLLPLNDEEHQKPGRQVRLATEFNRRTELLSAKFGSESWYLSNNSAYESGVHVQSCGHHVHLTCHDAYLSSLYTSQRHQNLNVERGEFLCPVCRQLSNSVLPLSPALDRPTPLIRIPSPPFKDLVIELTTLIKENRMPTITTKLSEAMNRAMDDMTNSIYRKAKRRPTSTLRKWFLFVTSIARTNLEAEIIQRGGSLCSSNSIRFKPKRDCIVPLLHVLSVRVRISPDWQLWRSWASLCGIPSDDAAPAALQCIEHVNLQCIEHIPNLLSDPIALMLKYILLAPLHLDQVYFTCIVKATYNLLYYQVVVQICSTLTESECDEIISKYSAEPTVSVTGVSNLGAAIVLVLDEMMRTTLLRRQAVDVSTTTRLNMDSLEQKVQQLCLPFLRVASLLKHHLYQYDLPDITASDAEFRGLVNYLELVTPAKSQSNFNSAMALCFLDGNEKLLPRDWCNQLIEVQPPHEDTRELIFNQHISWQQPRLLGLPREYEQLFTYYHEKPCLKCNTIPKESSICLLCGTIVCLKQLCCEEDKCCEAVRHTMSCGGGAGIFLVVTSTYIIVIRGRRACLWGSLYLDDFFEEDRDLKRGKPLYLNEDRFSLLESQWLSHRFAHTKHTWVFHRDTL